MGGARKLKTMEASTGLAGLEPTTYGLGNRPQGNHRKGSGVLLPRNLPKLDWIWSISINFNR